MRRLNSAVAAAAVPLLFACLPQARGDALSDQTDPPPGAALPVLRLGGAQGMPSTEAPAGVDSLEGVQLAQLRPPRPGGRPPAPPSAATAPSTPATLPSDAGEPGVMPGEPMEPQLGLTGLPQPPRSVGYVGDAVPSVVRGGDFLPIPDRWRLGQPRGSATHVEGDPLNPYRQNVLKGDYPILGTQDIFFILGLTSDTLLEARRTPIPSGVSTARGGRANFTFFGEGDTQLVNQNFIASAEIFQGNAAYLPKQWAFRATAVFNVNYVHAQENFVINPDVRKGEDRTDTQFAFQELFYEQKLADLSNNFDTVSVRLGTQGFTSDFRGFLFSDNEPGVRLFGSWDNNRWQYNIAFFNQVEKDTNSGLNEFNFRNQQIYIANLYRQDFLFPGYTAQLSFHGNIDKSGLQYDTNGFLVRPAPLGDISKKEVRAYYLGWAGEGHIGRFNITHQFYQVLGTESFSPLPAQSQHINAQLVAAELSYDFDYVRLRGSFVWQSGDNDPEDGDARGFDGIFDNPNFAGGGLSFYTRQVVRLTGSGVGLMQRNSFYNNLRTSKEQGQAEFVNPGLFLYNIGMDVEVTPKLKLITNASYLRFDSTAPLELILQDDKIGRDIGLDLSAGIEYRPLLNNNVIFSFGAAALIPGQGFKDLYASETLYSVFMGLTLTY